MPNQAASPEPPVPEHVPCKAALSRAQRFAEHPLGAWLIENGAVWAILLAQRAVAPAPRRVPWRSLRTLASRAFAASVARQMLRGMLMNEPLVAAQYILIHHIYAHRPFFTRDPLKRPRPTKQQQLADWLQCNFPIYVFGSAVQALSLSMMPREMFDEMQNKRFRLVPSSPRC